MAVVTGTGSVPTTTLLVSSGAAITAPVDTSTSLLQGASATLTGSGTTVLFLGRVASSSDAQCQVDISIDGASIYGGASGEQIIARATLAPGSHTVTYTAYALGGTVTISKAGLTVIDLGL